MRRGVSASYTQPSLALLLVRSLRSWLCGASPTDSGLPAEPANAAVTQPSPSVGGLLLLHGSG